MSRRLSGWSGWAAGREGSRLARPAVIVPLGLLGEAGTSVTVVSLPGRRRPEAARRAGLEGVEKVFSSQLNGLA